MDFAGVGIITPISFLKIRVANNVLHMDQVCSVRFLGCEQTRYNQKFRVQGWENGELGVRIVTFVRVFENLGLGRVFC